MTPLPLRIYVINVLCNRSCAIDYGNYASNPIYDG